MGPEAERVELSNRLRVAREAAGRAGKITLKYFQTDYQRETKADGSVVTPADRESEQQMRKTIGRAFPDDGILGEEFAEKSGKTRYRWILDPIDGTLSFAQGVPLYGVLIGIEDQETRDCPVGVIHLPALGEMVYAQRGQGCSWVRRAGRNLESSAARVSQVKELDKAVLLATDFWSSRPAPGKDRHAALARLAAKTRVQRTWADCYGYVLVATGRADMMLDCALKIWDCAPLPSILEEAGGTFTDWSGKRTIYGDCGLATNKLLLKPAIEALDEAAGAAR